MCPGYLLGCICRHSVWMHSIMVWITQFTAHLVSTRQEHSVELCRNSFLILIYSSFHSWTTVHLVSAHSRGTNPHQEFSFQVQNCVVTYRGAITAEKLRETKVWVPRPAKGRAECWVREGVTLPLWGSGCITPGKFLKTRAKSCILVTTMLISGLPRTWDFVLFENYGQEVGEGDQYIVGLPT